MIAEGDKIAVGVSGGKDSLTLLCALAELRRFYPNKFDILALSIDMGFDGTETFQRCRNSVKNRRGIHNRKKPILPKWYLI